MRRRSAWVVVGLSLALSGCADDQPGPGATCEMRTVADMPVLNDKGSPIIKASINGTPVAFLIDTGARTSIIFETEAQALGLPIGSEPLHLLDGVGGSVFSRAVTIRTLSLGTAAIHHVELDTVPGPVTRRIDGLPLVGLFGGDFLVNYDTYFDLPSHLLSLYEEHHCSGNLRPWRVGGFYRLPFALQGDTQINLDIAVNGHTVPIELDSGASTTILDAEAGRAAGAVRATMAQDPQVHATGIDGNDVVAHRHRFDTLDIGPEHFAPVRLEVGDIESNSVLGAEFLRGRRVWISYPHAVLYVQPVPVPSRDAPGARDVARTGR